MTEGTEAPKPSTTAGALLRRAREAQGLHIAALAASLKVPQRKLEALERDEYEALPDLAFTRALAQTICRSLKIDAAPVLALLPRAQDGQLEHVSAGLNTPFRDRDSGTGPDWNGLAGRPVLWVVGVILLGALAVAFWPARLKPVDPAPSAASAPSADVAPIAPALEVASAPSAATAASTPDGQGAQSTALTAQGGASAAMAEPAPAVAVTGASAPLPAGAGPLELRASAPSWVQVTDAGGRTLLSRTLAPGEAVKLDGALPFRLTIGNAAVTGVRLRGEPVDLAPHTRDNIARFTLP
ncbi:MAG: helix-turn-helix domain-containing protein [Rubrivivax sp.]|nr:helix-turn-helix domain-containing protein [Rubrivivax sp.]MDH5340416.1 helix-turn-helix domain-containing protein [Rubrivivax sp.]